MSSGSHLPPSVKAVGIPKKNGGKRILGVPTVADRVPQMVVKACFEPTVEPHFHPDFCGYRPRKSAANHKGPVSSEAGLFAFRTKTGSVVNAYVQATANG
jgi:hypothetical protein